MLLIFGVFKKLNSQINTVKNIRLILLLEILSI